MAVFRTVHKINGLIILVYIQIISRGLHGLHLHCVGLDNLGHEIHVLTEKRRRKVKCKLPIQ